MLCINKSGFTLKFAVSFVRNKIGYVAVRTHVHAQVMLTFTSSEENEKKRMKESNSSRS